MPENDTVKWSVSGDLRAVRYERSVNKKKTHELVRTGGAPISGLAKIDRNLPKRAFDWPVVMT